MKFVPVILFLVTLLMSPGLIEVHGHAQADDDPYSVSNNFLEVRPPRPVPQDYLLRTSESSFIPQWIADAFPSAGNIFSMNVYYLVGTPYEFLIRALNQVCSIASDLSFLKQDYVPKYEDLQLRLYAGEHIITATLNKPSALLESEYFDEKKNVTIFVTGFETNENSVHPMKDAYQRRGGSNFIVFNVGRSIENLYQWINMDIAFLGGELGNAVKILNSKIAARKIHIVGHSVGAHIAGIAGNYFHRSTGEQIGRITGLDPSSPCVRSGSYLEKGDAAFVDIIHSSSGALGVSDAVGDADFYPNGRVPMQPGCWDVLCSHSRAISYYIESVYPGSEDAFPAVQCASVDEFTNKRCHGKTIPLGYSTPATARGLYYLETNPKSPYGKNSE